MRRNATFAGKGIPLKKILIIQTAFLGDVVLATPLIEKARATWPEAEIDFLLRKGNESLLKGHPHLRRVLVRDKSIGKWKSLRQMLKVIRRERYDLVVNVHRFLSSGLIAGFSNGRHICGFDKNPLSWRYHHKVPHIISEGEPYHHETDRNLSLIAHLTDGKLAPIRLYPSDSDFSAVAYDKPYLCIAPTSVWYSKQWPASKWVELIRQFDQDLTVFLLGAPADRPVCEEIAKETGPQVVVKAGELNLLQSAALMAGAKMNYVNDSAPMHLASAMNAPVTAVFLSTVPRFGFGPRSEESHVVETPLQLDCRPCGLHGFKECPKGHFKCAEIEVNQFPQV